MKKKMMIILSVLFLTGNVFGQGLGFQATESGGKITITGYTGNDKSLTIPAQVNGMPIVAIGNEAFRGKGLLTVNIPNSVVTIGENAFSNNQLTNVIIGNSVTSIGDRAFSNNRLTTVTIPDSVTSIGESAFYNNQLGSVTFGSGVITIGKFAFSTNQLSTVSLPNSVSSIGDSAFSSNKITRIVIGANVKLGKTAFPNSFENAYREIAGTYTRTSVNSEAWAKDMITF